MPFSDGAMNIIREIPADALSGLFSTADSNCKNHMRPHSMQIKELDFGKLNIRDVIMSRIEIQFDLY